jgi:hypothetical protein
MVRLPGRQKAIRRPGYTVVKTPSVVEYMRRTGGFVYGETDPDPPTALQESRGGIMARQLRRAAARGLIADPVSRAEHPPVPGLVTAGTTEGHTFGEQLRNLGVRVFDRAARALELGRYVTSAARTDAMVQAVHPNFGLTPHDAAAELGGYVDGDEAA